MAKESLTGDETERIDISFLNQRKLPKRKKYQGRQPTQLDRVAAAKTTRDESPDEITIAIAKENAAALEVAAAQRGLQVSINEDDQATLTRPAGVEPQFLSEIMAEVQELSDNPTTSHLAATKKRLIDPKPLKVATNTG